MRPFLNLVVAELRFWIKMQTTTKIVGKIIARPPSPIENWEPSRSNIRDDKIVETVKSGIDHNRKL